MAKSAHAKTPPAKADVVIVGGGFYGCCLALFFKSIFDDVVLLEARPELLTRASYVNQARIHTGFHYPRSFVTAQRSLNLYERFIGDFPDAVVDDFSMLYAIARHGSKITPERFSKMFSDFDAPIEPARTAETALFDPEQIAQVFRCKEFGFDAVKLRKTLAKRMKSAGVQIFVSHEVEKIHPDAKSIDVGLAQGNMITAPTVIDATYGQFAAKAALGKTNMPFKYELTEVALVTPPAELAGLGVTVMDGNFFSVMPFAAQNCYSMTHVRYTPHRAWAPAHSKMDWSGQEPKSHWLHMRKDAERFLPCMKDLTWQKSLFEIKTVSLRNERDDGRPILLSRHPDNAGFICVLGGKLDNIYDLFEAITAMGNDFASADTRYLSGSRE